jgi:spore germination protein GerM
MFPPIANLIGKYDKFGLGIAIKTSELSNYSGFLLDRSSGLPMLHTPTLSLIPMHEPLNHTVFTQKLLRILALISVWGSLAACGNTTSSNAPVSTTPERSSSAPKTPSSKTTSETTANSAASDEKPTQTVQVYWLKDTGTKLEPVPVSASVKTNAKDPNSVLKAAFEQLLSAPSDPQFVNAIPKGTQVRTITVKGDGIYVDLSPEFAQGGGSAGIIGRLAQVLYTATSLDSQAAVWIRIDGKPLTSIGGEGIEIPQPMTRQNFQEQFEL